MQTRMEPWKPVAKEAGATTREGGKPAPFMGREDVTIRKQVTGGSTRTIGAIARAIAAARAQLSQQRWLVLLPLWFVLSHLLPSGV